MLTWQLSALCYKPRINCIRRVKHVYMDCISGMEDSLSKTLKFVSVCGKHRTGIAAGTSNFNIIFVKMQA